MIRTLDDLPDAVIGFEADGEIHAEDYATTRQDLQMGVEHLSHWK
ncbi:MAG: hypothetical protein ACRDVO_14255 [Jiangellaceae bacterium]